MSREVLKNMFENPFDNAFGDACKETFGGVKASEELRTSVLGAYDRKGSRARRAIGTSALTAAAASVCVLLLGGGVGYALSHSSIRDFFFPFAGAEFEEVYTTTDREYRIGSHKVMLDGVIYDETAKVGYLSLHFLQADGSEEGNHFSVMSKEDSLGAGLLNRHLISQHFSIGGDDLFFIATYVDSLITTHDGANQYLKFFEEDVEKKENCKVRYAILDREKWTALKSEIDALDSDELIQFDLSGFQETGKAKALFDWDTVQPEVMEILEKYGLEEIDYKRTPAQIIDTGKCRVIVGRTEVLLEYNQDTMIGKLLLRREDGSELLLIENNKVMWEGHCGTGLISDNGSAMYRFEPGYVLEENERVSVILDGTKYE